MSRAHRIRQRRRLTVRLVAAALFALAVVVVVLVVSIAGADDTAPRPTAGTLHQDHDQSRHPPAPLSRHLE